jgi:hypothetical protein
MASDPITTEITNKQNTENFPVEMYWNLNFKTPITQERNISNGKRAYIRIHR